MDKGKLRKTVQIIWGIITNANIKGFLPGGSMIYEGPLKRFCVPGMNCYSCPGALGACPIGSIQASLSQRHPKFPFYVLGFIAAVGLFVGRFICGWLCLFGLLQELLYMIPVKKFTVPDKTDRFLRKLKYAVLVFMVILLPLFYRASTGAGYPFFCKYLCPVGTLEAGVPLVLLNEILRSSLGWLYRWKILLMVLCLISCMFIYRPFCKYICPLGAFYSLFQKISILRMNCESDRCISCGKCAETCRMNVDPSKDPNSPECIRCGECISSCPVKALSFSVSDRKQN